MASEGYDEKVYVSALPTEECDNLTVRRVKDGLTTIGFAAFG
jgi:hypothetical protein